jgi:hypothetical protein
MANGPGMLLPAALVAFASLQRFEGTAPVLLPIAAVVAIAALYVHEWVFVRAGQLPPLS